LSTFVIFKWRSMILSAFYLEKYITARTTMSDILSRGFSFLTYSSKNDKTFNKQSDGPPAFYA